MLKLGSTDINKMHLGGTEIKKAYLGGTLIYDKTAPSFDADAQAFITAAGITDSTQQNAIDALVVGLKADSLWAKITALHPMVGGTATTHKYNLKDPQDLDAAFRLTFAGGWTHDANGITGNGTNAYADTHFNTFTEWGSGINVGWSVYLRNTDAGLKVAFGQVASSGRITMFPQFNANYLVQVKNSPPGDNSVPHGNFVGLHSIVVDVVNNFKIYQAGSLIASRSITQDANWNNTPVFLCAGNNNGTPAFYSAHNIAMSIAHEGLDATEMSNLNSRVQTFQTSLSRNV